MIFDVRGLSFDYSGLQALSGVSFAVRPRQRIALLGANGSGKSTLLRLLDGLCFPSAGAIAFDGQPLTRQALESEAFASAFRRRVAFVFQNPDVQLFNPTVFDEVAFGPLQLRLPDVPGLISAILDRFQIAHLKDRPPHRLSGGEKKRVALASALVLDPDVLLLDEPTAALDPESQGLMIEFLLDSPKTVITATHNLDIVEEIADHCIVLRAGHLIAEGPPAQILANTDLLRDTHLLRSHRHRHGGVVHSHPHIHTRHDHPGH